MMFLALVLLVVFLLAVRRARSKRTLAGLDANRPTFTVEPPARRLGTRKGERL